MHIFVWMVLLFTGTDDAVCFSFFFSCFFPVCFVFFFFLNWFFFPAGLVFFLSLFCDVDADVGDVVVVTSVGFGANRFQHGVHGDTECAE